MNKAYCLRCGALSRNEGEQAVNKYSAAYRPLMTKSHQVCNDCFSDNQLWNLKDPGVETEIIEGVE